MFYNSNELANFYRFLRSIFFSIVYFCLYFESNFFFLSSYSSDESLTPGLFNDSYNLLTAHTSQSPMGSMQMQLQTTAITTSTSMNNMYPSIIQTAPGTSGLVQSQSHTQPLEQLAYTEEFLPTAGIDEQYIYVTYPSEVKKRSSDRYELLLYE